MKKDYRNLREKAIKLRNKGLSYGEIKDKIKVPKSTLSSWLKDIPLKEKDRKRLYTKSVHALNRGPNSQKERRKREINNIIENSKRDISFPIKDQTLRLFGAALYWAEGTKGSSFIITNSDPHLILFMTKWIEKFLNVSPEKLGAHLNIYKQQDEKEVKNFWSDLTGIPINNFGKSYIKPPNKGYKKNNLYYGTIKVRVPKSSDTVHRVFSWVESVLQEISPEVELTQKKWVKLKDKKRANI